MGSNEAERPLQIAWSAAEFRRRFTIALCISIALVFLELIQAKGLIKLFVAVPLLFWCAAPVVFSAFQNLNKYTLLAAAMFVSYFFSVATVLIPKRFPSHVTFFPTVAALVLVSLGASFLEAYFQEKRKQKASALLALLPERAKIFIDNDIEAELACNEIQLGHLVNIKPGDKIPVDGVISFGSGFIEELSFGQVSVKTKGIGSPVLAGSVNKNGNFVYRATCDGKSSYLVQMANLLNQSAPTLGPLASRALRLKHALVLISLFLSLACFYVRLRIDHGLYWNHAVESMLSLLLICCPFAFELCCKFPSILTQLQLAETGVLVGDQALLEQLANIDTLLLEKRGLLTEGRPQLITTHSCNGISEERILSVAAALERYSDHPIAFAIQQENRLRNLPALEVTSMQELPGVGIYGMIDNEEIFVGSKALLNAKHIDLSEAAGVLEELEKNHESPVFISIQGKLAGILALFDKFKEGTLDPLKGLGLSLIEVTSDSRNVADAIAKSFNIQHVYADLLPQEKTELFRKLEKEHLSVALVTHSKLETNFPVPALLMRNDFLSLPILFVQARQAVKNMRVNLLIAIAYNSIVIPCAIFFFSSHSISPIYALIAMLMATGAILLSGAKLDRHSL